MTRPWRRITLHLSQIGLTLSLPFIDLSVGRARGLALDVVDSLVAVDDAAAGQVVRTQLHHDTVLGEDPDVVLAHLARDVRENLVAVGKLDPEHGVR